MIQKSYDNSPSVYIIPTPIGNMEDITIRAINLLKSVDVVFSEDTRVTRLLFDKYEINNKLIANHEHNEDTNKEKMLKYLIDGKNIGIVTDRGTPAISDPGYHLVKFAIENNYNVIALPGPTALIPALIMSGLDAQPFLFYGFMNSKESKRKKELDLLKNEKYTIIFYEAPHRIKDTLNNIKEIFGNRDIAIAREISKRYEEVIRGTVDYVLEQVDNIKGEMVLIVSGSSNAVDYSKLSVKEHLDFYISQGIDAKDAIKIVSKERNLKKNDVYDEYHDIRR